MIEVKVHITGLEELSTALITLASALAIGKGSKNPDLNRPVPDQAPQQAPPTAKPAVTVTTPVNAPPSAPQTPPAAVPTSTRTYTVDELSVAGAQLMQTVGMPKLTELINSFGVASLMELPKERYNEFAARLREMGAQL